MSENYMRILRAALRATTLVVMTACQPSCGDVTQPEFSLQTVKISADRAQINVVPGATTTVNISVTMDPFHPGATLSVPKPWPDGLTFKFVPDVMNADGISVLTITADSGAAFRTVPFEVEAQPYNKDVPYNFEIGKAGMALPLNAVVEKPFTFTAVAPQSATVGSPREVTIAFARASTFGSGVTLRAVTSGPLAGAEVTFSPATVMGASSTLRLTVPAGVNPARYPLPIVGTAGAFSDTTVLQLDVQAAPIPPNFTIAATQPTSRSVAPGGSATFTLALARSTPAVGNIALTIAGLPTGATAVFTPPVVGANENEAHFVVNTTTAVRDSVYVLTITGRADTLVRTTVDTLFVVTPPSFTMTVAPRTLTLARGESGELRVTVHRVGVPSDILLSAPTVPSGVSASAGSIGVNDSVGVITVSVSGNAQAVTRELEVRARFDTVTRSAPYTLIIPAVNEVAVQLATPTMTIAVGETGRIPIRLTRLGLAEGQEVTLSAVTAGGLTDLRLAPSPTTADTASLFFTGGTIGSRIISVRAQTSTSAVGTAIANITVVAAAPPDFSLQPAGDLTAPLGATRFLTINILRTGGFTGAVSFETIWDEQGTVHTGFSPQNTTESSVQLNFNPDYSVPYGQHTLTVRARSGSLVHDVAVTVFVVPPY